MSKGSRTLIPLMASEGIHEIEVTEASVRMLFPPRQRWTGRRR
jgi:hypothetical protein